MHQRNRTWLLGSDPVERCRQRTMAIEGGDGSTLNLDFRTGVLDPRLTFSRASTATFVNSSGYVEWAGANTAAYSESLITAYNDNAILSRSTTTSPTGNTAVVIYPTLVSDYHRLQFTYAVAMVGATTLSVYVKQIGSNFRVGINSTGYIGAGAIFSLVGAGSVVALGGTAANRAATITKVTDDGWYRIALTGTYATITSTYLFMDSLTSTDYTGGPFTGVASQGVSFWGFQINPGSTTQTYYPTTSTVYHAPRFDYSPTNIGEPRGLLIEGQTANVCPYSQAIAGAGWSTTTGYTVTANTTDLLSPSGDNTATKLVYTSGYARCIQIVTLVANTTYTMSYWIKSPGTHTFRIYDTVAGADIASSIGSIPITSAWTRVQKTFTTGATTTTCWFYVANDGGPTAGMTAYVWGAQLEAGSGASSYIPTGASQVIRTPDLLAVTSTTTMGLNTSEGTFFVETELPRGGTTSPAQFGTPYANGSWLGQFYGAADATTLTANWWGGSALGLPRSGNPKSLTALSYGLYTGTSIPVSSSLNGAVSTGTFTTSGANNAPNPATWNFIALACNATSLATTSRDNFNACIKRFKYYPTRLSDAQLQALTTP